MADSRVNLTVQDWWEVEVRYRDLLAWHKCWKYDFSATTRKILDLIRDVWEHIKVLRKVAVTNSDVSYRHPTRILDNDPMRVQLNRIISSNPET